MQIRTNRVTPIPKVKKFAVMGTGLPQRVMVKHKYVTTYNPQIGTGLTPTVIAIRANGMYDPEVVLGGHQPMYFDQYAALYNHYTVIGSKITFDIVNADIQESQYSYTICAYLDDDATLPSGATMEGIAEQTQGRKIVTVPGGANNRYRTSLAFSAKRTFGGSVIGNRELGGTATTDPVEGQYFMLCMRAGLSHGANLIVTMHVEYIAIWSELKDVAQS